MAQNLYVLVASRFISSPSSSLPQASANHFSPLIHPSIRNNHKIFAGVRIGELSSKEIPPNALRRKRDPLWKGGFSLGIDLGMSRVGLALSKGYSLRPLTVLELRGQKLENRLLQIAEEQEADEFIIGLPLSSDGKETPQSNKVRSIAGRLAVQAAERGWRIYLQDEHGTSIEALNQMIDTGLKMSDREKKLDSYAAMLVLQRYFSNWGEDSELVIPKQFELQQKMLFGPPRHEMDLLSQEFEGQ